MLDLHHLTYRYRRGRVDALTDVSASFSTAAVSVLGPNGAGKSTLLNILTTTLQQQEGTFSVGTWRSDHDPVRALRRSLGYVPQALAIPGRWTCTEFLEYVAWLKAISARDQSAQVDRVLALVDLTERRRERVGTLSGGMRQRLVLAQALLGEPALIVLDEPTVGLDPKQRNDFRRVLRPVAMQATVVLATHLVDDVAAVADEILVLDGGRVSFAGPLPVFSPPAAPGQRPRGEDVEAAYLRTVREDG